MTSCDLCNNAEELALFSILKQQGFDTLFYLEVVRKLYDIVTVNDPYLYTMFKD